MVEIDVCPFCGSDDVDAEGWGANDGRVGPCCMGCGATAETVIRWNIRPEELRLKSALKAIADLASTDPLDSAVRIAAKAISLQEKR